MTGAIRDVLSLFGARERWQLAVLFAVMVVVALVQTLGVASILPFMSLASNPDLITDNEWMRRLYDLGGFESARSFLVLVGLLVLAVMAFSNASAAFEHWLVFRFVWRKQHRLSVRLLRHYLDEPYTFFLAKNTSALTKNILAEVGEAVNGVILPMLRLLAQILISLCVLSLLLLVDSPVAIVALLVLGGAYAVIFVSMKQRQKRLGRVRRRNNGLRYKAAAEALGSIKEVRVLGAEEEFSRRFAAANLRYSDANASNTIMRDLPRYGLEMLAFGALVSAAVYLVQTREDFGEAMAIISLYALASYRLMPAMQQIFRSMTQIRFFLPALQGLRADLERRSAPEVKSPILEASRDSVPFDHQLVLDSVTYRYPGSRIAVLQNITLQIPKNSSVAFVGETGCGKTTLVDVLLGLLEPEEGRVIVDDLTLTPANLRGWRGRLGYVPQHIYLCDDTITRNIALGVADLEIDLAAVKRAARAAHLHDFIAGLPHQYETVIGEQGVRLSGGQRQRIGIARALYRDPEVLVMDEATSALDGMTEEAVIRAIRDLSGLKTMILVAHRLSTVQECDTVFMLERGKIVASGTYRELLGRSQSFRAMARRGVEEAAVS